MSLRDLLKEYKYDKDFIYEGLIIDISTQLKKLMEKKGVTKKQLAERMNVKPSYITKIFGGSNISIRTIAKVLSALEVDATISIEEWENGKNIIIDNDALEKNTFKNYLRGENEVRDILSTAA